MRLSEAAKLSRKGIRICIITGFSSFVRISISHRIILRDAAGLVMGVSGA